MTTAIALMTLIPMDPSYKIPEIEFPVSLQEQEYLIELLAEQKELPKEAEDSEEKQREKEADNAFEALTKVFKELKTENW
jgi:hypothetical protein